MSRRRALRLTATWRVKAMILELRDVCKDYTRGKNLVPVLKKM